MAYGIEIYNSSGNIQFSTNACIENLKVIDANTVTSTGSISYNGTNEILALNRPGTGYVLGDTNSTQTSWTNNSGVSLNYVKMRRMSLDGTAAEDSSGSYGIRVFTSNSGLAWSSNFSKGQAVQDIINPRSFQSSSPGGLNFSPTDHPVIYNGDPTGVYVAFGSMLYTATLNETIYHECFYFDYVNDVIRGAGGYAYAAGRGTTFRPVPNTNTCIIFTRNG